MTVGSLIVVIDYLGAVYGPLSAIAHTTGQLQGAVAGARRVREMLALTPETVDAAGAITATDIKGDIRFEDVGFSYPDGADVLHDIDFTAKPGQMIAVVGLTGAGKTTLVSLIPRFYEATTGRVLVDGVDVRQYASDRCASKSRSCRRTPCCSRARSPRTSATAVSTRPTAEIEEAARAAHAHDFVSRLPRKYETPVAEAGAGCRAASVNG